jgi:hypothetical protein
MLKISLAIVVAFLSLLSGRVFLVNHKPSQPTPPPTDPVILRDHIAGRQARLDRASWVGTQQKLVWQNGLDPYSATFRLVRPASDLASAVIDPSFKASLKYDYTEVTRAYADVTYLADVGLEWGIGTPVSMQVLFPSSYISIARAVPVAGTANYKVEIEFDQAGIDRLSALLGVSDAASAFVDWYGNWHNAGEPITTMRAVITSQNVALVPFSVNDLVTQEVVNQPIVVAKDMTQGAAQTLVHYLGF